MLSDVYLMVCGRDNNSTAVCPVVNVYQSALGQELSLIDLPTDMILCDGGHCTMHI